MKRVILTGFEPFGGMEFNPSADVVHLLPNHISLAGAGKLQLEKAVLPVCGEQSFEALLAVLNASDENRDITLIMLGLANGMEKISLERVGLNLRDYRIADNQGHKHKPARIHPDFADAIISDLAIDAIAQRAHRTGHAVQVSNHAGAFVCNEIYFRAMRHQKLFGYPQTCLFVHLPMPEDYLATMTGGTAKMKRKASGIEEADRQAQLQLMKKAVLYIVRQLIKQP